MVFNSSVKICQLGIIYHEQTEMCERCSVLKTMFYSRFGFRHGKIESIPDNIKELYKTNWELSQKIILDMAADRGAYIDQSQSLNIHIEQPTIGKISSVHFYGWKKSLKTGMYYLRTRPAADPIQITVDKSTLSNNVVIQTEKNDALNMEQLVCSLENKDACTMCGAYRSL